MSVDKRTPHTDALDSLGSRLEKNQGERDAIHLAVEPVIAGEVLNPGDNIGLRDGKAFKDAEKRLGVVDPFLKGPIAPGERFWLIVYPRTITSLRHVWAHPDFQDHSEAEKQESLSWIAEWCAKNDVPNDPELVMAAALGDPAPEAPNDYGGLAYVRDEDDEYITFRGRDAHCSIPDEFWYHLERATGRKVANKAEYFSCSC